MNDKTKGIFRRPPMNFLICALAAYAVSCLVIVAMEVTRVALTGIPWNEYATALKGRSFFTITPLFALCLCFVWCLVGRLSAASLLLGGFSFFLLFVHLKKMEILEQPLIAGDFTQIREALGVTEAVFAGHWGLILGAFAAVGLTAALLVFLMRRKPILPLPGVPFRIAYSLIFASALLLEVHHPWLNNVFAMQKVSTVGWNLELNLDRNGLLLSLILDAREVVWRPVNYSREAVEKALMGNLPPSGEEKRRMAEALPPDGRPDILLILGEAFWDVTQLPGVHFSRDPLPRFHEFQRDGAFRNGFMVSPSFAGQTGNAEFEVLTGIPLAALPPGATPYSSCIRRPLETIASYLKGFGYTAEAVHNYYGFYYRREAIYPWLGLDRFTAIDKLTPVPLPGMPPAGSNLKEIRHLTRENGFDALYDGAFPSDEPLMARVMELLEQQNAPRFLFAITVTAHGRYLGRRFPEPEVTVSGDGLSAGTIHELENYANALYRTDMALGWLLDRLRERKRPTVVAFFGDHLPGLTAAAYSESGMVWDSLEINKHTTPVFLWSNRPLPEDALPSDAPVGAHYLGLRLLKAAGIPLHGWFAALDAFQKTAPVLDHGRIKTGSSSWFKGDESGGALDDAAQEALHRRDDFFLLAYDRLFGRQFSMMAGGLSDSDYHPGSFIEKEGPFWKKAGSTASGAAPQASSQAREFSGRKAAVP